MRAHEMPAGAIVASESRVWIKRNSADRYPPPHPGYEEWWTEGTAYTVPISNREVDEMLGLGTVDLLRPPSAPPPRGAPGTWRCNTVERCFREDGHDGRHGFAGTPDSGSHTDSDQ